MSLFPFLFSCLRLGRAFCSLEKEKKKEEKKKKKKIKKYLEESFTRASFSFKMKLEHQCNTPRANFLIETLFIQRRETNLRDGREKEKFVQILNFLN